jgi:DNA-binding MarR family transcriptional regulator
MTLQDAITDLVLETFRLNGRLLASGDALVADLGLSSARWQVLGAMALSPMPLSVAQIARNMGLTRQAVQRLANEMEAAGLLRFAPNPHHQRAKLVLLTAAGKTVFAAAMKRQAAWAAALGRGLGVRDIAAAATTLRTIRRRLENGTDIEGDN